MDKIRKILFHRIGIVAVFLVLQIVLYISTIIWFSDYIIQLNWIFRFISALVVLWLVNDRSDPGYKLGWIIIVLVAPVVGGLLYLLLGGNRLSMRNQRKLKVMQEKIDHHLGNDCCRSDELAKACGEDAGHMVRYLERAAGCPVYGNTRTKYYSLGDHCFPDMLEALESAEKYIFLEYFIIEEGEFWNKIFEVLCRKAGEGVDVRVIYDDVGSIFTLPSTFNRKLEQAGIRCQAFNRFMPVLSMRQNNRDHRKYLIVDGRAAFTGGLNLADEYINRKERFGHWKDSAIRLEGDAVWSITVSFLAMWGFTENADDHYSDFQALPMPGESVVGGYVQPYWDCPWDEEPVGQTVYLNLINRAKRYVYMTTPYLVLDHATTVALKNAAKSGVDVRILTPHIPDKKAVFELTRAHYEELIQAGVRIFEYTPGFIHAKNFVVDDVYGTVGTVNMDYRSMFLHFEDGVMLYQTETIHDLREDFLKTQAESEEVSLEWCRRVSWIRQLFRSVIKVFAPLL